MTLRSVSSAGFALRPIYPSLRKGLKWLAHRNSMLLGAARGMRSLMRPVPRPAPAFNPLEPDAKMLAEFAAVSPALRDAMMVEFTEMARVMNRLDTGADDARRWLAEHPIESLLAAGANLNLVYSPPKVGGTTVAATLHRHPALQGSVRHCHFLSGQGIAYVETVMQRFPLTAGLWRDNIYRARWFRILIAINRALRAKGQARGGIDGKLCIVAGVREPIALHLSFCFEGLYLYGDTPDILTGDFVHDRLAQDAWHLTCNDWFDDDLKELFGIDVFAGPFDAERGWEIYENDEARVLVIRQENLTVLPDALGALYHLDPASFTVVSSNIAEEKVYARQYSAAKKSLRLSEDELDSIYSLPYVQHFYTRKEIQGFKTRWQAATARSAPALRRAA